jgi:hypothetical protein
MVWG